MYCSHSRQSGKKTILLEIEQCAIEGRDMEGSGRIFQCLITHKCLSIHHQSPRQPASTSHDNPSQHTTIFCLSFISVP